MIMWLGITLGLFVYKFMQYRNKAAYEVMGHCVCMAKGVAETLKINMALILLPVCRNNHNRRRRRCSSSSGLLLRGSRSSRTQPWQQLKSPQEA
ncbi:hypothetical protein ACFX2H_038488 [Malus domestica]